MLGRTTDWTNLLELSQDAMCRMNPAKFVKLILAECKNENVTFTHFKAKLLLL